MNATLIALLANLILGSGLFDKIKQAVKDQEGKIISGAEKKNAAISQLTSIGVTAATSAINLGIELAVAWLKAKK